MKKSILGLLLASLFLFGCSPKTSTVDEDSQKTIDSLKKENNSLKAQVESMNSSETETTTEESSSTEEIINKPYKLGEEAILQDSEGTKLYSLKIIKATTAITPNSVATYDDSHKNLVEITYEYKNYSVEKALSVSTQFLSAYDQNGLAGKNLGYMDGQTEVSSGGKASQSTMWFEMNSDPTKENSIEIEYSNDFSIGFDGTLSFNVPLEH